MFTTLTWNGEKGEKKKRGDISNILATVLISGTHGEIAGITTPRTVVSGYRNTAS